MAGRTSMARLDLDDENGLRVALSIRGSLAPSPCRGFPAGLCVRGFSPWTWGLQPQLTLSRSGCGYRFLKRSHLVAPSTSQEADRCVRDSILEARCRA